MNIVHVIPNIGASAFGPGQVALHLAREQNDLKNDTRIWCLNNETDRQWASSFSGFEMNRIRGFELSSPRGLLLSRPMERAATLESERISVLHQHCLWTGLSRVAPLLRGTIPAVISPHGALEAWALKKSWWKKQITLALYERDNLRGASCLHACAGQEVAGFREFGLSNPVAVIPNGISSSWLEGAGDGARFRSQFAIESGKRILLFLSRVTPVKGLPLLIEALAHSGKRLADWTLVVAGGDEFGHLREIQDAIARHRLGERVIFTGLLAGQQKRDAFAAAELFVLPTRREASPVVVLEALGAGVPVLTTKGAPWEELLTERCGWWVDVDAEAIAQALEAAASCAPEELKRMGQRGKALVAGKYSWSNSARMTAELYGWLLGRGERPSFVAT